MEFRGGNSFAKNSVGGTKGQGQTAKTNGQAKCQDKDHGQGTQPWERIMAKEDGHGQDPKLSARQQAPIVSPQSEEQT